MLMCITKQLAYDKRMIMQLETRARQEMKYPNVTWHIILSVYLLTLIETT